MNGLTKAISVAGSQRALAKSIGLGQTAIANWIKRGGLVPVEYCAPIETACAGAVTRRELRPSDWKIHWPELATLHAPHGQDRPGTEPAKPNQINERRVFVCRAEDRKRLGLDIPGPGQGI